MTFSQRVAVVFRLFMAFVMMLGCGLAWAQPASNGMTGYINNPSAHMAEDGTWRLGFSYASPFAALYSGIQILPWLEATARFTQIHGAPNGIPGATNYGSFKDKSVAVKATLISEGSWGQSWFPELAFGVEDKGFGTSQFANYFGVASKRLRFDNSELDATIGYGRQGIKGAFSGLRYKHKNFSNWAFVGEFDRHDYSKVSGANVVGLDRRKIGRINVAAEYTWLDGIILQVGSRDGQLGLNASVNIPFGKQELMPKIDEPAPYLIAQPRPLARQWKLEERHWQQMIQLLHEDGARNVRIAYDNQIMRVSLEGTRQLFMSRTVGRAARIILAHSPVETEKIEITCVQNGLALATFTFGDIPTLHRYFNGVAARDDLERVMQIRYASPSEANLRSDMTDALLSFESNLNSGAVLGKGAENFLRMSYEKHDRTSVSVGPYMGTYFNDPSGAFKYELGAVVGLSYALAPTTFIEAQATRSIVENVSDVNNPSNSLLPHVRTDAALYNRASKSHLERLLINHYFQPQERVFGRLSAGYYERMFGGIGGQLLYVPKGAPWAIDMAVDSLRQRAYSGTRFLNYTTVTALLSGHYKLPYNLTATARVGQFLAKDKGVRAEIKREFASGVQIGAWYSLTNGKDTTSPGTVSNPYRDKGIFMNIPFDVLLTRNTSTARTLSLAPWTRDVGQMVESPGNLFEQVERGFFRYLHEPNRLRGFGDVPQEDRR